MDNNSSSPFPLLARGQQASASDAQAPADSNNTPSHSLSSAAAAPAIRRGRARSTALIGAENPILSPLTEEEQHLANLASHINRENRRRALAEGQFAQQRERVASTTTPDIAWPLPSAKEDSESDGENSEPTPRAGSAAENRPTHATSYVDNPFVGLVERITPTSDHTGTTGFVSTTPEQRARSNTAFVAPVEATQRPRTPHQSPQEPANQSPSQPATGSPHYRVSADQFTHPFINFVQTSDFSSRSISAIMNTYPNYIDSPMAGPNPRQAPPTSSQGMHQNGMNGGMVGFPTPAGHQSDLNYIMQMVEELSGQLAHNQGLVGGIVDKMGKVRAKAKNMDLSNDELLAIAASELNVSSENIEKENSELRKALEKALHDKKENWKLAIHGANILADVLEKMHAFKEQHEKDTLAWHKNYRMQLADERAENLMLRDHIQDKIAAAARANEHMRQMRRFVTDHPELHELRVENDFLRKDRRMWKRMAMPLIPDDDSEWSDDDDIIDPEEKKRKAAEDAEREFKDKDGQDGVPEPRA